jgi:hypothetical protein
MQLDGLVRLSVQLGLQIKMGFEAENRMNGRGKDNYARGNG